MRLVYLTECGQSGTPLGRFLEAVMRGFKPDTLIQICGRLERNVAIFFKDGWSEERREQLCLHLNSLIESCNESGFKTTSQHAALECTRFHRHLV